jgi:predicted NUDIX family phosphoesterase
LNFMVGVLGSKFVSIEALLEAKLIAPTVEPMVAVCELLADCGVWFGPRRYLEEDENWRQLIPYVLLHQDGKYLVYKRANHIEEQRLANRMAIGWGGHIDIPDVKFNQMNELCLRETVMESACRELQEECGLVGRKMEPMGLIISDDETGKVHVGLVLVADVFGTITAREDLQLELQWLTPEEIVQQDGHEGWTTLVAEELMKNT